MKRIAVWALALILAVGSASTIIFASGGGGFEGNGACETCLENALEAKRQCEALWDYGEGDPDCEDKYMTAVLGCQSSYCIY